MPSFDSIERTNEPVVELSYREIRALAGTMADVGRESAVFSMSFCLYSGVTFISVVNGWRVGGRFVGCDERDVWVFSTGRGAG